MDEELELYFKIQHVKMQVAYHEVMKKSMEDKLEELHEEYREKFNKDLTDD